MAIRKINDPRKKGPQGTKTFHNAADHAIQFTAGWLGGRVEMDPGDEVEVPVGLTIPNGKLKRIKESPQLKGKRALYYVSPHLAEGPAPKKAPAPAPEAPPAPKDSDPVASSPSAVQAESDVSAAKPEPPQGEVAKLVADHDKAELRQMAKDLGVDARGSEQSLAERIAAAMA